MLGDEIWDEHRWEVFLRESDRRLDRYMDVLFSFMADNPPPDVDDLEAREAWRARLGQYLQAKGLRLDDDAASAFLFAEEEAAREEDGWDLRAAFEMEEEAEDALSGFRTIPVYRRAFALATEVLAWTDMLPGDLKDSALVHFCSNITQISSNIAKGHGIGYERDMIGGNIACAKRGITAANAALELLREMKQGVYMDAATYRRFYELTFEVRNELGLYIQELRQRFDLGID